MFIKSLIYVSSVMLVYICLFIYICLNSNICINIKFLSHSTHQMLDRVVHSSLNLFPPLVTSISHHNKSYNKSSVKNLYSLPLRCIKHEIYDEEPSIESPFPCSFNPLSPLRYNSSTAVHPHIHF